MERRGEGKGQEVRRGVGKDGGRIVKGRKRREGGKDEVGRLLTDH